MLRRYQVSRRIEVKGVSRLVRAGSCDAESVEAAVRKVSSYTGVPVNQLEGRDAGPPLKPVGEGKLP